MNALKSLDHIESWGVSHVEAIIATTFTFDPQFFTTTGVLPALAGLRPEVGSVNPALVRQELGNPLVTVIQGSPSEGPTPGWIDRYLWPTHTSGLLHAKCLLVVSSSMVHCLFGSANLTAQSWRMNDEIFATVATDRRARDSGAPLIAALVQGALEVCQTVEAEEAGHVLKRLLASLDTQPAREILWTGPGSDSVLSHLPTGERLTVVSPFWPTSASASRVLLDTLGSYSSQVVLVPRSLPTGELEIPHALVDEINARSDVLVACLDRGNSVEELPFRRLHAKQLVMRNTAGVTSYIGSANATMHGLGLRSSSTINNVELGAIHECDVQYGVGEPGLITEFRVVEPTSDLDDPETSFDTWAIARLEGDHLTVKAQLSPGEAAEVGIPGRSNRWVLNAGEEANIRLEPHLRRRLLAVAELELYRGSFDSVRIPVILGEIDKLLVPDGEATYEIDDFLWSSRRGTGAIDDNSGVLHLVDVPEMAEIHTQMIRRMRVHRARDVVEALPRLEKELKELCRSGEPGTLIELRLHGPRGPLELGRRITEFAGSPRGLTRTASAFAINELLMMIHRLRAERTMPVGAGKRAERELQEQYCEAVAHLSRTTVRQLRQIAKSVAKASN